MAKVYLGVGHGGSDSGAVEYIVEKDVNLQMALACKDYLEANGVNVKISRTTDVDKDLNARINECNAYDPDLAIDVHNNAGGGDGFEVFHTIYGGTGKTLAENIEKEVKAIGQNSRGCKTKKRSDGTDYYGFIRWINCPSVICEGVFVDNKSDAAQADTLAEQKAFGVAYAKGILKTLGITTNNKPDTKPDSNKIDEDGKWGKDTTKKAQQVFGTMVDGIVSNQYAAYKSENPGLLSTTFEWKTNPNDYGSELIRAIQKKVGANVDGYIGTETIKKMQKWLGTIQDGCVSNPSDMVKAFQKWLNK